MTSPRITAERARELLEGAKPEDWHAPACRVGEDFMVFGGDPRGPQVGIARVYDGHDAALIAAAPSLAATVIAQEEEIGRLREVVEAARAVVASRFDGWDLAWWRRANAVARVGLPFSSVLDLADALARLEVRRGE